MDVSKEGGIYRGSSKNCNRKGFSSSGVFQLFADVIDKWAHKEKDGEKESDHPALWWVDGEGKEVKWSFQDLSSNSKRAANVLRTAANITPGDKVMVLVHRIPEYWLMQVACLRTGAILVAAPANIGPAELDRRISACKPVCFLAGGDVIDNDLLNVIDQFSSSPVNTVKCRLMVNRMKQTNRVGWLSFEELFQHASNEHESVKSLSSAPITIVFTSGTTGNSKMVEHSQASWGLSNRMDMGKTGAGIIQSDLVWLQSSTGWVILLARALRSWSVGAGLFFHYKDITPREALETFQKFPVTFALLLPSMYIGAAKEDLKSFNFPTLNCCTTTGEPMNKLVTLKWKQETGIDLRTDYGQTETGLLCVPPRDGENRIGSVGKAFHGVDVVIIDDNNQEVCPGKLGRVVVRVKPYRPVGMFNRYVDDPQSMAARFSGDFYITDDLGFKDEDGYFWIVGRTDDIIFLNAVNINPYDVEECLMTHPAVQQCAVVSSPDSLGQAAVKAFVVLSNEFKNKEQDEMMKELQDHVQKSAGAWMSPAKMEFVNGLPTTITGKINRKELKQKEWKSTI
ncbi:acyl-CoA synthetase medium-chain member 4 [Desmophyllum pertusum]|uniref:medium-chain acyl-CoA ligase n=1 Tax=Desmophyllum pertusum TaxID=174260 RepID=A0A9W9Z7V9_9CNID|nr:acyl-CoA synthetase medium-chain member 4 [Desmophyllum pertusum]